MPPFSAFVPAFVFAEGFSAPVGGSLIQFARQLRRGLIVQTRCNLAQCPTSSAANYFKNG